MRATRLSVANYNTTLSSGSLEIGTGSSNSVRSANESLRTDVQLIEMMTPESFAQARSQKSQERARTSRKIAAFAGLREILP